ncbi:MAG: hypothetical protein ACYSYU_01635 [Planctomycetota bacterium]|jgi:hypothetical protein
MGQIDKEENVLSETNAGQEDVKFVPVTESIRYRKRAQAAEKEVEALTKALAEAEAHGSEMGEQLQNVKFEQKLVRKLASMGAVDLETAVLLAKSRAESSEAVDLDSVVEQLKKEKRYLFNSNGFGVAIQKTTGPRGRLVNDQAALTKAAKKAATTGSRTDLQEYLRLRRKFV